MAISIRAWAIAGSVVLLGGCAAGPYNPNYDNGYAYDPYAPGPVYNAPVYNGDYADYGYVAPSVGFGFAYTDGDRHEEHREWHGDHRNGWRGDRDGHGGDRGGRDHSDDHGQRSGG
jgi:hypothetical protein